MARIINDRHLFIHSAKTGGTFLRETINRYGIPNYEVGEKHSNFKDIITANPELKKLRSFGYVRNPLTWYRSRWAYGVMTYFGDKVKYMPEAYNHWMSTVWHSNLNQFVENTLRMYPEGIAFKYFNKMLGIGEEAENRVHTVYRYENLPYTTAFFISECKNEYIAPERILKLPRSLDSSRLVNQISHELQKEIQVTEHKLFEMFY